MDSTFAKLIFYFASILGLISSPAYVQLGADSLTFDFKTGDSSPIIYYLNVKNVGPLKARFDVSSDVSWVSVSREGSSAVTSAEILGNSSINFVLEIQARTVLDGSSQAQITVNAVDLVSYDVIDSKKTRVILNKNIKIETVTVTPSFSTSLTPAVASPVITAVSTPIPISTTKPAPTTPSARFTPVRTVKPTSTPAPSVSGAPTRLLRPVTPQPTSSITAKPPRQKGTTPLNSLWRFFKDLFF